MDFPAPFDCAQPCNSQDFAIPRDRVTIVIGRPLTAQLATENAIKLLAVRFIIIRAIFSGRATKRAGIGRGSTQGISFNRPRAEFGRSDPSIARRTRRCSRAPFHKRVDPSDHIGWFAALSHALPKGIVGFHCRTGRRQCAETHVQSLSFNPETRPQIAGMPFVGPVSGLRGRDPDNIGYGKVTWTRRFQGRFLVDCAIV